MLTGNTPAFDGVAGEARFCDGCTAAGDFGDKPLSKGTLVVDGDTMGGVSIQYMRYKDDGHGRARWSGDAGDPQDRRLHTRISRLSPGQRTLFEAALAEGIGRSEKPAEDGSCAPFCYAAVKRILDRLERQHEHLDRSAEF